MRFLQLGLLAAGALGLSSPAQAAIVQQHSPFGGYTVAYDLNVTVRPLNCAIRKRRTSFWSAVSNVNIRALLCSRHYRILSLVVYENPRP